MCSCTDMLADMAICHSTPLGFMLQEGFELPSSLGLHRRGAGWDVVLSEASGHKSGCCPNIRNCTGPETDSLDHRARVCYFPCGFSKMNIIQARHHSLTLGFPLHIIEICFALSQSRPTSFLKKIGYASFTN